MTTADLKKFITETLFTDPHVREAMESDGNTMPPYYDVRNWKRSKKLKIAGPGEFADKLGYGLEDALEADWTYGELADNKGPWVARYFTFSMSDALIDPKLEEELGDDLSLRDMDVLILTDAADEKVLFCCGHSD